MVVFLPEDAAGWLDFKGAFVSSTEVAACPRSRPRRARIGLTRLMDAASGRAPRREAAPPLRGELRTFLHSKPLQTPALRSFTLLLTIHREGRLGPGVNPNNASCTVGKEVAAL